MGDNAASGSDKYAWDDHTSGDPRQGYSSKTGKRVIAIEKGRIVRDEFGAYGYEEVLADMEMTDDTIQSKRTFRSRFRRGGDDTWL